MASTNRADRIDHLYKALRKHYKPVVDASDRKVLDCLLYACCLEDASYEAADEAFAKLQQAYFDANEIRVTTVAELAESLTSLPKAAAAAGRIKKSLQSLFEARYSFDIDDLKKANLGKAIEKVSGWEGTTKFVMAYVTQHAFGGHSIPIDNQILSICVALDLLTLAEAQKGILPGVERAIPKNKGLEFSSLLQQFAVEYATDFHHPVVNAVFKEMGVANKVRVSVVAPVPVKDTEKAPLAGTAQHLEATNAKAKAEKQLAAQESAANSTKTTGKTASKDATTPAKGKATKMTSGANVEEVAETKAKDAGDSKKPAKLEPKAAPKVTEKPTAKTPGLEKASSKPIASSSASSTSKSATSQPAKADTKSTSKIAPTAKTTETKSTGVKSSDSKSDKKKTESKTTQTPPPKASTAKSTSKAKPTKSANEKSTEKPSVKPVDKSTAKKPASKTPTPTPVSKKGTASKQLPVKAVTKKNTKPR